MNRSESSDEDGEDEVFPGDVQLKAAFDLVGISLSNLHKTDVTLLHHESDNKAGVDLTTFENDMDNELDDAFNRKQLSWCSTSSVITTDTPTVSSSIKEDDENDDGGVMVKEEEEDPLYDPTADDVDEEYHKTRKSNRTTDAVLNCPACMTTLCVDCQRHATIDTQYRAVFVTNCTVDQSVERIVSLSKREQRKRKKNSAKKDPDLKVENVDRFNPVRCSVCKTEVAVFDCDEVYHFHNVLIGYA